MGWSDRVGRPHARRSLLSVRRSANARYAHTSLAMRRGCDGANGSDENPDLRNVRSHPGDQVYRGLRVSALTSGRGLRHWAALRRCHVSTVVQRSRHVPGVVNIIIVPPPLPSSPPRRSRIADAPDRYTDRRFGRA